MHQLKAIQSTLDQIEHLITHEISIEQLAKEAAMSYWHFQRTFAAMVGDPVGRYIRRRRIAHAAMRMVDFEGTLLDLALEYQFESHEAFTRAFKSELSVTPSNWRAGRGSIRYPRHREILTQEKLNQRYINMTLLPEFVTLPSSTFVGLQARYLSATSEEANNMTVIPKLWAEFFQCVEAIKNQTPNVFYGLCNTPEALGLKRNHPDEGLYLAAAQVEPTFEFPNKMKRWATIGGLYAKFEHHGPIDTIGETMAYIYGKWFPESEYIEREGPDFNRFDERFLPESDKSIHEVFVPITLPHKPGKAE